MDANTDFANETAIAVIFQFSQSSREKGARVSVANIKSLTSISGIALMPPLAEIVR
ncbi:MULTISPECIES: hypothetical protein [Caballeronia]|uniref:hypothetical protein n=1 Tax=Caballeronia TaxID=1827195 RepID=UPI00158F1354|nr:MULTISPECIES: hypothetical protein [Caballeronia]MCG7401982.1 hypothetical protein [Caballeronia zhejiangensis]MCI1042616.1 hypothetical protein [Caballeronia zhejiangensis]